MFLVELVETAQTAHPNAQLLGPAPRLSVVAATALAAAAAAAATAEVVVVVDAAVLVLVLALALVVVAVAASPKGSSNPTWLRQKAAPLRSSVQWDRLGYKP